MPLFNIYLQSPRYKKSDLYLRSMSLNWINWGLVWIAQHKLFHCDQESNLLTSHQASTGQGTQAPASDWSASPDAGPWLAQTCAGLCSLSRGANWNEWVLIWVWRQGDSSHTTKPSKMEMEKSTNESVFYKVALRLVHVNWPPENFWLLGNWSLI